MIITKFMSISKDLRGNLERISPEISFIIEILGLIGLFYFVFKALAFLLRLLFPLLAPAPPKVVVPIMAEEMAEVLDANQEKFNPEKLRGEQNVVHMWDPSTLDYFGTKKVMDDAEVKKIVGNARVAQNVWKMSTFATRKKLMRTMLRYITENQEVCARVAVRESGKTLLDALIGEVLVTCEKLAWLAESGEKCLQVFLSLCGL